MRTQGGPVLPRVKPARGKMHPRIQSFQSALMLLIFLINEQSRINMHLESLQHERGNQDNDKKTRDEIENSRE